MRESKPSILRRIPRYAKACKFPPVAGGNRDRWNMGQVNLSGMGIPPHTSGEAYRSLTAIEPIGHT